MSTGAWEAEEYEGVLPPSTAARWTADDFLFFQTLCRLGEEEEEEEDELGRREGEEEKGLSESFGFTGQLFFPLWIIKRSSNPFVCPNMWCCERNPHSALLLNPSS